MATTRSRGNSRAALEIAASPARLELLEALAPGPATTRELATRLGRSRQSLYYHLNLMIRGGMVEATSPGNDGTEQRFALRSGRLVVDGRHTVPADMPGIAKTTQSLLRAAGREAAAALADPATRLGGPLRQLVGVRGKARLTRSQLKRANELIDELLALFRDSARGEAQAPYSLTIVLTPARRRAGPGRTDG